MNLPAPGLMALVFVASVLLVPVLKPLAFRLQLVDAPGERKQHLHPTALTGGVAMFMAFALAMPWLYATQVPVLVLVPCALLLVAVGVIDDRFELPTRIRFLAQIAAGVLMCVAADVRLADMGWLRFDGGLADLGIWTVPISVFCVVGVINAINMLDGLDGLAGGMALIAGGALGYSAMTAGRADDALVLGVFCAAVAGFWCWNVRYPGRQRASVFMGDAGSLFIGLVLAWYVIDLSQGDARAIAPVQALWFMMVPLFDTVRLLIWRPARGCSPFGADRDHLHHVLRGYGLSHAGTAWSMLGVAAVSTLFALSAPALGISELALFYVFMTLFTAYALIASWLWLRRQ